MIFRRIPLLGAVLKGDLRLFHGVYDRPALDHGISKGLLDEDMLTRADRRDGRQRVPVFGYGDKDRVHILESEELPEITAGDAVPGPVHLVHHDLRLEQAQRIDIAKGRDHGPVAVVFEEVDDVAAPTAARAYDADPDPFFRSGGPGGL